MSVALRSGSAAAAAAALTVAGLALAPPAHAEAVIGGQLYSAGGQVTVTVLPAEAGLTSTLGLCQDGGPIVPIATNRDTNQTFTVGTFPAGTEMEFCIQVQGAGDTFYMGPASRNPDRVAHASVDVTGPETATVGFEDIWGGGDRDYNDNLFAFTGVGPTICPAAATTIWPPNNKMQLVTLPDGSTVTGVTQDEPLGTAPHTPDAAAGPAANQVYLRAERDGAGDGRVYVVSYDGTDAGAPCVGTMTVAVPHDQAHDAVDSGQTVDSFGG